MCVLLCLNVANKVIKCFVVLLVSVSSKVILLQRPPKQLILSFQRFIKIVTCLVMDFLLKLLVNKLAALHAKLSVCSVDYC